MDNGALSDPYGVSERGAIGVALETDRLVLVVLDSNAELAGSVEVAPLSNAAISVALTGLFDTADSQDLPVGVALANDAHPAMPALNQLTGALNLLAIEIESILDTEACLDRWADQQLDAPPAPTGHFTQAIGLLDEPGASTRIAIGAALAIIDRSGEAPFVAEALAELTPLPEPTPASELDETPEPDAILEPAPEPELDEKPESDAILEPAPEPELDEKPESDAALEPELDKTPEPDDGPGESSIDLGAYEQALADAAQATKRCAALEAALADQKQKLAESERNHSAAIAASEREHEAQLAELQRIAAHNTDQIDGLQKERRAYRQRANEFESQLISVTAQLDAAVSAQEAAERRARSLVDRNRELEANVDVALDIQMQLFQLKAKVSNLTEHLDRERRKTKDAQAKSQRLRQDLSTARLARGRVPVGDPATVQRAAERQFFSEKEFYRSEIAERDHAISELTDKIVAMRRRLDQAS